MLNFQINPREASALSVDGDDHANTYSNSSNKELPPVSCTDHASDMRDGGNGTSNDKSSNQTKTIVITRTTMVMMMTMVMMTTMIATQMASMTTIVVVSRFAGFDDNKTPNNNISAITVSSNIWIVLKMPMPMVVMSNQPSHDADSTLTVIARVRILVATNTPVRNPSS